MPVVYNKTLSGKVVKMYVRKPGETRGRPASVAKYRYLKGRYSWEQVFLERIEERVNLKSEKFRKVEDADEFERLVRKELTGKSNNEEEFWKNIKQTNRIQEFLFKGKRNRKLERARDERGYKVKRIGDMLYYEVQRKTKTGKVQVIYKDLDTGRFRKKPEVNGELFKGWL